jgi:hypothetical protein
MDSSAIRELHDVGGDGMKHAVWWKSHLTGRDALLAWPKGSAGPE